MEQWTIHDLALMYLNRDHRGFVLKVDELIQAGEGVALALRLTDELCVHLEHLMGHDATLAHIHARAVEMNLI